MMPLDAGHKAADEELKRLEAELEKLYKEAAEDLQKKAEVFMRDFERKDTQMQKQVEAGKITEEQYEAWRKNQMLTNDRIREMEETLAKDLARTDQIAAGMIDKTLPSAYAENFNFGTYEIETGAGIDTSFTLYDKATVENLLKEDPKIIPQLTEKQKAKIPEDERWNRKKLTSAVAQGILQGESVPKIANRLQGVAMMDRNAAIRNARTYTTAAENKGRVDAIERANEMGIPADQEWIATLDDKTRMEHRHLDGQVRPVGEYFEADGYRILYPGDPMAEPEMIYNCRCTLVGRVRGRIYNDERNDSKLEGMSYEEWKHAKDRQMEPKEEEKAEPKPEDIKTMRHYTKDENADAIMAGGFNNEQAGTGAGTTWGEGAYFLQEGSDEEKFYKYRLETEDFIEAKVDTSGMLTVNTLSPDGKPYGSLGKMYDDAAKSLPEEYQKEYKDLCKEMDKGDAFKEVAEEHYTGLIIEQELKSGAIDPITGGNQVLVFDTNAIIEMTRSEKKEEEKIPEEYQNREKTSKQLKPMTEKKATKWLEDTLEIYEDEAEVYLETLQQYTGSSPEFYRQIHNNTEGEPRAVAATIDEMLKDPCMPVYDGTIYRGIHVDDAEGLTAMEQIDAIIESGIWNEPGLTSFTSDKETAEEFAGEHSEGVNLIIVCDENISGVPIAHLSDHPDEAEVLVPSDIKDRGYTIVSSRKETEVKEYRHPVWIDKEKKQLKWETKEKTITRVILEVKENGQRKK